MARLSWCWLIVDHVLLGEGFDRWRRLGVFVHPLFVVLFQLYVFSQLLITRSWDPIFCAFRIVRSVIMSVFLFVRCFLFRISEVDEISPFTTNASQTLANPDTLLCAVTHDDCGGHLQVCSLRLYSEGSEDEGEEHEESTLHVEHSNILGELSFASASHHLSPGLQEKAYELADEEDEESTASSVAYDLYDPRLSVDIYQYGHADRMDDHGGLMVQTDDDLDIDDCSPHVSVFRTESRRVEIDLFYENYSGRMRWFDQLNAERRIAVSVVLGTKLGATSFHDRIDPLNFSFPAVAHKKLAKSIESDFELVYVGQSCLSWEALCHQHRKVKLISDAHRGCFHGEVAEKFQQFQILLERFTETENCEGKRFWHYAQTKFCNAQLLQIPDVSGYVEDVGEGKKGETMEGSQVLEAIEKAMSSFWLFLRSDNKRCRGILRMLQLRECQVEDPKDLQLFTALSKEADKKNVKMKASVKKSRGTKAAPPREEIQVENLIRLVDINLVMRVLKMSVVTSAQLRWCHEKLRSVEFEQGIVRTPNAGGLLFPYS
ncbi:hypothetical protein MUK42_03402 [Musa troglodytarum]|uniref:Uncharacterized protein n=1 Tax=Musa troglodytarum TaxID=320322 RepID=A0A9E7HYL0_9LILI|nr:hypothetical protein MUK42_03402 [Musa troglodytarum]